VCLRTNIAFYYLCSRSFSLSLSLSCRFFFFPKYTNAIRRRRIREYKRRRRRMLLMTQSNILLSSLLIQSRNEYTEGKEEKELADQTSFKAFIFY